MKKSPPQKIKHWEKKKREGKIQKKKNQTHIIHYGDPGPQPIMVGPLMQIRAAATHRSVGLQRNSTVPGRPGILALPTGARGDDARLSAGSLTDLSLFRWSGNVNLSSIPLPFYSSPPSTGRGEKPDIQTLSFPVSIRMEYLLE